MRLPPSAYWALFRQRKSRPRTSYVLLALAGLAAMALTIFMAYARP
jgi:hypothetical protein